MKNFLRLIAILVAGLIVGLLLKDVVFGNPVSATFFKIVATIYLVLRILIDIKDIEYRH